MSHYNRKAGRPPSFRAFLPSVRHLLGGATGFDLMPIKGEMMTTGTPEISEKKTANLLEELHQRGVTYQAVADRLGVNWRTVHRWANSETQPTISGLINGALTQMLADRLAGNNVAAA